MCLTFGIVPLGEFYLCTELVKKKFMFLMILIHVSLHSVFVSFIIKEKNTIVFLLIFLNNTVNCVSSLYKCCFGGQHYLLRQFH